VVLTAASRSASWPLTAVILAHCAIVARGVTGCPTAC
jgi:hypothetical protein